MQDAASNRTRRLCLAFDTFVGRNTCTILDCVPSQNVVKYWFFPLAGVVFPYYSHKGRYHFNFFDAQQACRDQDATLATFEQLYAEWEDGLDWCNAGWLADGTVQYPIRDSRVVCGGKDVAPGVRSYGLRHKILHQYDAFCFTASIKGQYQCRSLFFFYY